jgi:hypothetical protein
MKKCITAVSLLIIFLGFTGCKYPQTLEDKPIQATIYERAYEKDRDYYFVVLSSENEENRLTFRTSRNFYENTETGQQINITVKKMNYLGGTKTRYYWNGEELNNPFIQQAKGDIQLTVTEANKHVERIHTGNNMFTWYTTYDLTFTDRYNHEVTASNVENSLWESVYIGETLFFNKAENTAKIKSYNCDYYLNDIWMFKT